MTNRRFRPSLIAGSLVATLALLPGASAQDEKKLGWTDRAEFSFVSAQGNADSTTLGLKNDAERTWERAIWSIRLGALRTESSPAVRFAIEDAAGDIRIVEPDSEVTAENYFLRSRYGHDISKRMFWFVGASWERNPFAGFDNRWVAEGGVGNTWWDREDLEFRTGYSLTVTNQDDIVVNPALDDTWTGFRFSWRYLNKFGDSMTYTNELILDANLEESSRWRGDNGNDFTVSMSNRLALNIGLRLLYQNEPPFEELRVFDLNGDQVGTTFNQLDQLDTLFSVGLIVNFQ